MKFLPAGSARWLGLVLVACLVLAGASGLTAWKQSKQYQSLKASLGKESSGSSEDHKVGEVVEQVGQLIELPQGEEPTVATVSDTSKLEAQPFFARAQNGDQVLIFTVAQKAILYRPSNHKIIEVAPININANQAAATPEPEPK